MKLYLVTRQDLPDGVQASQLVHAGREYVDKFPEEDALWYRTSNTVVLLTTENEATLEVLLREAQASSVSVAPFREPDRNHELTAIALGNGGKRLCRGLRLALG
jgi:hypothetical protein